MSNHGGRMFKLWHFDKFPSLLIHEYRLNFSNCIDSTVRNIRCSLLSIGCGSWKNFELPSYIEVVSETRCELYCADGPQTIPSHHPLQGGLEPQEFERSPFLGIAKIYYFSSIGRPLPQKLRALPL